MRSQSGSFICLFASMVVGLAVSIGSAPAQDVRQSVQLGTGWRFSQTDTPMDAERPDFADGTWQSVTVPHTWNRVGLYEANNPSHINKPEDINKTQGIGWYRLAFDAPGTFAGRKAWLQFDGASIYSEVWLNGVKLGEHRGAFSRFRLDATAALKPGAKNVLAVKTDNSAPSPVSPTADILPIIGDFFIYGGLYRPVSLIGTAQVHVDMLDYGSPGLYLRTNEITSQSAAITIGTRLRNETAGAVDAVVHTTVRDAAGTEVATAVATSHLDAGGFGRVDQPVSVPNPHLWQATADPYLYIVNVDVSTPSGTVLDSVSQRYGIREMTFDADRGLILNGKPTPLHGVTMHQDRDGKGWAVSQADLREDMTLITEMGANSIRLTHYQHASYLHDLADEMGVILWDEIPFVTKWTDGTHLEPTPALVANARQQMTELIRQNQNHPSVAVWGLANEVDFGLKAPGFLGGNRKPAAAGSIAAAGSASATGEGRRSDPTHNDRELLLRSGAGARCRVSRRSVRRQSLLRLVLWYPADMGTVLDTLHKTFPAKPMGLSEYGAGAAVTEFTDNPLGGPHNARGRPQPEDYQSYFHEAMLPIFAQDLTSGGPGRRSCSISQARHGAKATVLISIPKVSSVRIASFARTLTTSTRRTGAQLQRSILPTVDM